MINQAAMILLIVESIFVSVNGFSFQCLRNKMTRCDFENLNFINFTDYLSIFVMYNDKEYLK